VIAALQTRQINLGETALALLAAPQPPPTKTILTLLINELGTFTTPLTLVLDDYHVITAQPIHEALSYLIDHLSSNLRLILISRIDPPLPLARWRVRNQLTEIRAADLRFTPAEATIFFNQAMELNLTPAEITTLDARTEGWIAGLQLAALSLRGVSDRTTFVASFSGTNRLILDYLVEEVLNQQSSAVRDFLLSTAILDRLCAPLCNALLERTDSQAALERLERANLFLLPLDQECHWHRYHHLFAETLRHRLRQQPTAAILTLYQRASDWHEQVGLTSEAVRYALAVEDWTRVARIIEQQAMTLLGRGEAAMLRHWLTALPMAEVRVRPYLNLVWAWVAVLAAQYAAVETHLQAAEAALTAASRARHDPMPVAEIEGQIAAVQTLVAVHRHDPGRARELGQRALQTLPEENHYVRAMVLYALGLAEWSSDNAAAARALLTQVSRLGNRAEQRIVTFAALNNLGGLQEVQGKWRQAAATYQQALALATEESGVPLPLAGQAYLGLGFLQREWHELTAAEEHFRTGLTLSQRAGFEVSEALAWFGLALTHQAQGDTTRLAAALAEAEKIVARWGDTPPPVQVSLYQARLALLRQDWQTAASHCQERPPNAGHIPQEWREGDAIMQARVMLAQGQTDQALTRLNDLRPKAEETDRGWHLLEIRVLQALAWQRLGDLTAALGAIERALTLAEPEGYVHLFTDEGAAITPLLRKAAGRGVAVAYVGKLLGVLEPTQPPLAVTPPGVEPLREPLSDRELEVLRLMAAGLPNQAIADELVVVLGTVKAHINHIYQKLGVMNRVQAITRARMLHLL
jgi:LuxR family maltose regulon positive regulatory protein